MEKMLLCASRHISGDVTTSTPLVNIPPHLNSTIPCDSSLIIITSFGLLLVLQRQYFTSHASRINSKKNSVTALSQVMWYRYGTGVSANTGQPVRW